MSKQPGLFETPTPPGYPVVMKGTWKGFTAFALANTPERKQELIDQGYKETELKDIPIPKEGVK